MASSSVMQQAVAAITQVFTSAGLNPNLGLADAMQESGLNPTAVGDNGTSFGLFQLHEGGELDALPGNLQQQEQEAFDPVTNARRAVLNFVAAVRNNPSASPGEIAFAAEGPSESVHDQYVANVNANFARLGGGSLTSGATLPNVIGNMNGAPSSIPGAAGFDTGLSIPGLGGIVGAVTGVGSDLLPWNWASGAISDTAKAIISAVLPFILKMAFVAAGMGLIILGAFRASAPARQKITNATAGLGPVLAAA